MKLNILSVVLCALFFCSGGLSAQINYTENFNSTSSSNMPNGWTRNNENVGANFISCVGGNSLRFQMYWAYSLPIATWSGFTANGASIAIQYRYKILDDGFGTVSSSFPWGVKVSVVGTNGGPLYYEDSFTTVGPDDCGTRSVTIPENAVPANTPVEILIRATTTNLPFYDFYVYLDDFSVVQTLPCIANFSPANGSTNRNSYTPLIWDDVPGASQYKIYFGSSPNPPLVATQPSTIYTTGILQNNTTYYWKVVPENAAGIAAEGCPTYSFTTLDCIAALGSDVTQVTVPYSVTGRSTCASVNDLTAGNIPPNCVPDYAYLSGQDAVYVFTPTVSGLFDLTLNTAVSSDAALILYEGCPMMSGLSSCLTTSVGATGTERSILAYPLTAGNTYYLVVDNATLSNCIANYSLNIAYTPPNCVALNAPANADYNIPAGNITLLWTPNNQNGGNTNGYNVYFGAEFPPTNLVATTTGNSTLVPATEQGTLYAWKVVAYGPGGDAPNCGTYLFGTRMNNDACSNADAFPGLPANGSCVTKTVSTFGATGSASACQGTADDDVWYTFSIPSGYSSVQYSTSNLTYSYMNRPIDNNRVFEVYNGCGGALVGCYDAESGLFSNLNPGVTYYLRVFTQSNGSVSKFNLCLKLGVPNNNNCANAAAFPTLTADGNCATVSGNTANATNDGPGSGCGGNADDDVWYTFTIPAGFTDIRYNINITSGDFVRFNVYNSCGGTLRACSDGSAGILTNLGPGTYHLQAFTVATGAYGAFEICFKLRPPNDSHLSPIAIPAIPADGTCQTQFVNTFNSGNEGASSHNCFGNLAIENDVWFTFTAPAGATSLEYYASNGTSSFTMELYTLGGSYINCFGFNNNVMGNLTPGETYQLRIYSPGNPVGGSFVLCLKTAASGAPPNDEPAGAISITGAQGGFVNLGTQSLSQATQTWFPSLCCSYNNFDPSNLGCCDNPLPDDCFNFLPNAYDVWYKFTTNGGNINVSINVLNTDLVLEMYTQSGSPNSSGSSACNSGNQTSVSVTNLAAGTYYFRVYAASLSTASALFTIAATGSALPVELSQFSGTAETEGNVLRWTTQTEKNVQWHVVERSEEGITWKELGRLAGTNTSTTQEYRLVDRSPLPRAYYRLRSVDYDGQFSLSNLIALTRKWAQWGVTNVYPSPAAEQVTVEFGAAEESSVQLLLTDVSGRTLLETTVEANAGQNQMVLAVGALPPGLYLIAVKNGTAVSTPMRLVKQ